MGDSFRRRHGSVDNARRPRSLWTRHADHPDADVVVAGPSRSVASPRRALRPDFRRRPGIPGGRLDRIWQTPVPSRPAQADCGKPRADDRERHGRRRRRLPTADHHPRSPGPPQPPIDRTVGDLLGITATLDAIRAVERGEVTPELFDIIGTDWDIEARAAQVLDAIGVTAEDLERPVARLSGGETILVARGQRVEQASTLVRSRLLVGSSRISGCGGGSASSNRVTATRNHSPPDSDAIGRSTAPRNRNEPAGIAPRLESPWAHRLGRCPAPSGPRPDRPAAGGGSRRGRHGPGRRPRGTTRHQPGRSAKSGCRQRRAAATSPTGVSSNRVLPTSASSNRVLRRRWPDQPAPLGPAWTTVRPPLPGRGAAYGRRGLEVGPSARRAA